MKNITISIADDVYRKARMKAASEETSVSRVVQNYLGQWANGSDRSELAARLDRHFQESDRRDRAKKGTAGPFAREEIYAGRLARFR